MQDRQEQDVHQQEGGGVEEEEAGRRVQEAGKWMVCQGGIQEGGESVHERNHAGGQVNLSGFR